MQVNFMIVLAGMTLAAGIRPARAVESCTTQSQMKPAERDSLQTVATEFALKIQVNDQNALRKAVIPDLQQDFSAVANLVLGTSQRVAGATPVVDQLYILDASTLQKTAAGANPDAQFFCTLNQSQNEASFSIPLLPPGRYVFAVVLMQSATPYRLAFLLRQSEGEPHWLLAGLYPRALTAGGHDGLYYWKQARTLETGKEPWNAWLYLEEAQSLLQPAGFVSSTHLEKLQTEISAATPPALSSGISADAPLVVKAADGTEFRFTSLAVDDTLAQGLGRERSRCRRAHQGRCAGRSRGLAQAQPGRDGDARPRPSGVAQGLSWRLDLR